MSLPAEMYAQKNKQELELLGYNIGFGILTTTAGAIINKPKGQSLVDCIKKSWWQGALGGTLQYTGKKMTYLITKNENYLWGWPSKLVHSAGTSICHNAAEGRPFGEYWVLDYGPIRCNFIIPDKQFHVQPQFNLLFAYDLYWGLKQGEIDWNMSVKTGTATFTSNRESFVFENGFEAVGLAYSRGIVYANKRQPKYLYQTISHEIVHIYQANEYRVANTYFNPLKAKIKNKTVANVFNFVYIEIPFSYAVYSLCFDEKNYYKNIFEFEAQFFSTNQYVKR